MRNINKVYEKLKKLLCDSYGIFSIETIEKTDIREFRKLKNTLMSQLSDSDKKKINVELKKIENMKENDAMEMLVKYVKGQTAMKGGDASQPRIVNAQPVIAEAQNVQPVYECQICHRDIMPDEGEDEDGNTMEDHILHGQHHFHYGCLIRRFPAHSRVLSVCLPCPAHNCNRWCNFPNTMGFTCQTDNDGNLVLECGFRMNVQEQIFDSQNIQRGEDYYIYECLMRQRSDAEFRSLFAKIALALMIIAIASYMNDPVFTRRSGGKRMKTRKSKRIRK